MREPGWASKALSTRTLRTSRYDRTDIDRRNAELAATLRGRAGPLRPVRRLLPVVLGSDADLQLRVLRTRRHDGKGIVPPPCGGSELVRPGRTCLSCGRKCLTCPCSRRSVCSVVGRRPSQRGALIRLRRRSIRHSDDVLLPMQERREGRSISDCRAGHEGRLKFSPNSRIVH